MSVQRKCSTCQTWNSDVHHCSNCGTPISSRIIEEHREAKRENRRQNKLPSNLELFILKWEGSNYFILRVLYKIVYTIAFIFLAIASFFAYLAAAPNG
jgi:hypothetical protein